jgi:type II restriction enzyme
LQDWNKVLFLRDTQTVESKGWLIDTTKCVESLHKKEFTLKEILVFVDLLKTKHPNNSHVPDKIRQQLQVLRDK